MYLYTKIKFNFQRCPHCHHFHLNSLHCIPVGVPLDLLNPFPEVQIKSNKSQHSKHMYIDNCFVQVPESWPFLNTKKKLVTLNRCLFREEVLTWSRCRCWSWQGRRRCPRSRWSPGSRSSCTPAGRILAHSTTPHSEGILFVLTTPSTSLFLQITILNRHLLLSIVVPLVGSLHRIVAHGEALSRSLGFWYSFLGNFTGLFLKSNKNRYLEEMCSVLFGDELIPRFSQGKFKAKRVPSVLFLTL